jgi:hypothetical protein
MAGSLLPGFIWVVIARARRAGRALWLVFADEGPPSADAGDQGVLAQDSHGVADGVECHAVMGGQVTFRA